MSKEAAHHHKQAAEHIILNSEGLPLSCLKLWSSGLRQSPVNSLMLSMCCER